MAETMYSTEALSTGGGRNGHVRTTDGLIDLDLATPPQMGGSGAGTNPEQLFAAGYAACFHSALQGVARQRNASLGDSSVGARVSLHRTDDGGVGLAVELEVVIPELPRDEAQELADLAHQACPYSKATRGNIEVRVSVVDD
ncbi:organic hydroperoxide resistance protein [Amnibacterium endophyticum]|uniref:Organic hydroperoxide resistance protein n=1 Tax=Amnibacterium endophyticum TaxID=2109337 RepID=A0ABW4LH96_9MICO